MPIFVPERAEERNRVATHRVMSLNSGFLVLSVCSVANSGLRQCVLASLNHLLCDLLSQFNGVKRFMLHQAP
jgi:hypothetical protein